VRCNYTSAPLLIAGLLKVTIVFMVIRASDIPLLLVRLCQVGPIVLSELAEHMCVLKVCRIMPIAQVLPSRNQFLCCFRSPSLPLLCRLSHWKLCQVPSLTLTLTLP